MVLNFGVVKNERLQIPQTILQFFVRFCHGICINDVTHVILYNRLPSFLVYVEKNGQPGNKATSYVQVYFLRPILSITLSLVIKQRKCSVGCTCKFLTFLYTFVSLLSISVAPPSV